MFGVGDFWLETRVIIKISTHDIQETLTDFHGDEAGKKNPKWPTQKK
jgi:hypothetical protein